MSSRSLMPEEIRFELEVCWAASPIRGKTVIPFNTNAGYGVGSGFQTVKELCPNSKVLEGFEIKAGAERDGQYLVIKDEKAKDAETEVKKWLQKIKVLKDAL